MSQSNYGLPTPRTFNPQGQTPPTLQVSSMLSGIFCFIPLCNPSCCTSLWVSPIPLWVTIYLFSPLHLREHSRMPGGRGSRDFIGAGEGSCIQQGPRSLRRWLPRNIERSEVRRAVEGKGAGKKRKDAFLFSQPWAVPALLD